MFSTEKITESEQRRIFLQQIFRRIFLEDWGTKLVALGITLALWLGVTGLRAPITFKYDVPLIVRVPSDMEITKISQEKINISITADKRKIDQIQMRISTGDLIASVDWANTRAGGNRIILSPDTIDIDLPNGVKLDRVEPSALLVTAEKVAERGIPVEPSFEGKVADGYEIYSAAVLPAKARVRGAESIVDSLEAISTEPINIEGRKEGFTLSQIGLNLNNPKITLLDAIVDVTLKIGEKRTERLFIVKHTTENNTKNYSVTLFAPRSVLEKLRADNLSIVTEKDAAGEDVERVVLPEEFAAQIEVRRVTAAR